MRDVEHGLRRALDVPDSTPYSEYIHSWRDQVSKWSFDDVPENIRGNSPPLHPSLVNTPFAFYDPIPITMPVARPKAQSTSYKPKSISDILTPKSIHAITEWLEAYRQELARYASFAFPPECTSPEQREAYLVDYRGDVSPLIIGQDGFVEEARDIVWDVRDLNDIKPLSYTTPLDTHLDTTYLRNYLSNCRDKSMVSQICDTGVTFNADVPLQICLYPHLTTLPPGYTMVDKELKRLKGEGYLSYLSYLGFLPCRTIQQGTRARKLEPDRPRRISDAGCPRKELYDALDIQVVPLNVAIRAITVNPEDKTYQYGNNTIDTTGILGVENVPPPTPSTKKRASLPWEAKPHVPHVLHNLMVLASAASVFKLPIYVLTDDWKDMFNQFHLAPWELWKVGFVFLFLDDSGVPETALSIVAEYTLGYGYTNASNIAQRFANGLTAELSHRMHVACRPFFDSTERTPAEREYIRSRDAVAAITGRVECALFATSMYTDDKITIIVGDHALILYLQLWGEFVTMSGARMAIPEKRTIGVGAPWCGVQLIPELGFAYFSRKKCTRACEGLSRVLVRDKTLELGEYRSLVGLLEHLMPLVAMNRLKISDLYSPHRKLQFASPTYRIAGDVTPSMQQLASEWHDIMSSCPGMLASDVFADEQVHRPPPAATFWYIFGDAARERSTADSGLGGYMHGFGWRMALTVDDISGKYKLPITVLEYAVLAINLVIFSPLIPLSDLNYIILASDSLGSYQAITNLKSKSNSMIYMSNVISDMPETRRFASRIDVGHVFGAGNILADAESRGADTVIAAVAKAWKIEYTRLNVPKEAYALLDNLRRAHRRFVDASARVPRGSKRKRLERRRTPGACGPGVRVGEASHPGPKRSHPPDSDAAVADVTAAAAATSDAAAPVVAETSLLSSFSSFSHSHR